MQEQDKLFIAGVLLAVPVLPLIAMGNPLFMVFGVWSVSAFGIAVREALRRARAQISALAVFGILFALVAVPAPASGLAVDRALMLLPMADDTPTAWTVSGCVSQYDCLDDPVPHDVSATYLTADPATPGSVISTFQLQNLPTEIDDVVNVSFFAWALPESGTAILQFIIFHPSDSCAPVQFSLTTASIFTNQTNLRTTDCNGDTWTADTVNALRVQLVCVDDGAAIAEGNCRVTSMGLVVSYTTEGGIYTPDEYSFRLLLILFVLFLIAGLGFRSALFLMLAGVVGTFLAFDAFTVTSGAAWSIILFFLIGPMFWVIGAVMIMADGGSAWGG